MNNAERDAILKVMMNLEQAHEGLQLIAESYKRDAAYRLIEEAHQSVALLLVVKK